MSYHFGPELYPLSDVIHEAFDLIETVSGFEFEVRPPINDEPRIEFASVDQPGGILGEAFLYVADDYSEITGGLVELDVQALVQLDYQEQLTVVLHELTHDLTGALDFNMMMALTTTFRFEVTHEQQAS